MSRVRKDERQAAAAFRGRRDGHLEVGIPARRGTYREAAVPAEAGTAHPEAACRTVGIPGVVYHKVSLFVGSQAGPAAPIVMAALESHHIVVAAVVPAWRIDP